MIKIQRLTRPNKRSGFALKPLEGTKVRGVLMTNLNKFVIYVDKFTRKKPKKK